VELNLQDRIKVLVRLGEYLSGDEGSWLEIKDMAFRENSWFIPEFIDLATKSIQSHFLMESKLLDFSKKYSIPVHNDSPIKVGIVMAGNIPLVGFHDLLCTFLTGHYAYLKLSSRDKVLMQHIIQKMQEWDSRTLPYFNISEIIKGCDAYIATGSNNTARYFEYYFARYPHIIRKNRTSVAILNGDESFEELLLLADDVYVYFGLGCRNVTKLYVPENYNFVALLNAFKKYNYLADHNKYKNNYDYNLSMLLLNNCKYMSNESIILVEESSPFSRIAQLNYEHSGEAEKIKEELQNDERIQAIVSKDLIPFGKAQNPELTSFADGVDTMQFLKELNLQSIMEIRKS
jgi:hypothetical protein